MPHSSKHTLRDVNTYHHNRSLLFQFILSEFTIAFSELKKMQPLATELKAVAQRPIFNEEDQQILESLLKSTSVLAGSSQDYMRIFSWNYDDGILAKLKNYCAINSQNFIGETKEVQGMHRNAHKAWLLCLQTLDLLRLILQEATINNALNVELHTLFQKVFHKMTLALRAFAKLLAQFLKQFKGDENVIFFILRHHQEIDAIYESKFVAKLFSKMYSKKLQGARQFLTTQYAERGFEHLLPIIHAKFVEISE